MDLEGIYNELIGFEGKYFKKLSKKNQQSIHDVMDKSEFNVNDILKYTKTSCKISLDRIREIIESEKQQKEIREKIQQCESYQKILDAKKELDRHIQNLRKEYGSNLVENDMIKSRLINWSITHHAVKTKESD